MTTQHTPGPWRIVGGTEVRAGVGIICETAQYRAPALSDQAAADARLIAAAPDMLAALQHVLERATMPGFLRDEVKAAIARATVA